MEKSIKIAGAGLSGMSAAINLAKAGYKVTVYEKNKRICQRFHGDFQGIENWTVEEDALKALKRMNIKINFPASPSRILKIYNSSLDYADIKSKLPMYYLVRRGCFKDTIDYGFCRQAKQAGAKIVFNKLIGEDSADIIATGPKYCDGVAKGIVFETDLPDCTYALIDKKAAPKGYAYLIVNKGRAALVTCSMSHFRDINSSFDEALRKFKKIRKFSIKNKREFGGYGSFFLQNSAKKGGKLYVGESAGFQDYLFGFGIRYAITSGYLAAKSIIGNEDYDKLWKNEFGENLKMGIANRFIYEHFSNAEMKALELFSQVIEPCDVLRHIYKPTLLKRLLYPLAKAMMSSRRKCKRGCSCTWCREKSHLIG